jgi:hypothetical protein
MSFSFSKLITISETSFFYEEKLFSTEQSRKHLNEDEEMKSNIPLKFLLFPVYVASTL